MLHLNNENENEMNYTLLSAQRYSLDIVKLALTSFLF